MSEDEMLEALEDKIREVYDPWSNNPARIAEHLLSEFDFESKHRMILVEGEIEVCAGCVNSLGYNVAWEQAEH